MHLWKALSKEDKALIKPIALQFNADVDSLKCDSLFIEYGIATCLVWKDRPELCKKYPEGEKNLIEGCGYK